MHQTVKRVLLDFNWPLGKVWDGYVSPHIASTRCTPCGGHGYSPEAQELVDTFYSRKDASVFAAHGITEKNHSDFILAIITGDKELLEGNPMCKLSRDDFRNLSDQLNEDRRPGWCFELTLRTAVRDGVLNSLRKRLMH